MVVELETGCLCGSRLSPIWSPAWSWSFRGRDVRLRDLRSAQAEADLLFFDVDLDDLEVVLQTLLERGVAVDGIAGL